LLFSNRKRPVHPPKVRPEEKDFSLQGSFVSGLLQQIKLQELEIAFLKHHPTAAMSTTGDANKKKPSVEK
jgi:hypothetical protein